MNLSDKEFMSLSGQMSDRDVKIAALENKVKQLERDLLVVTAERDEWKQRCEQAETAHAATQFENAMLKNYLWLSWTKIKHFVAHVPDIRFHSHGVRHLGMGASSPKMRIEKRKSARASVSSFVWF